MRCVLLFGLVYDEVHLLSTRKRCWTIFHQSVWEKLAIHSSSKPFGKPDNWRVCSGSCQFATTFNDDHHLKNNDFFGSLKWKQVQWLYCIQNYIALFSLSWYSANFLCLQVAIVTPMIPHMFFCLIRIFYLISQHLNAAHVARF
jgi:hypothetical protein